MLLTAAAVRKMAMQTQISRQVAAVGRVRTKLSTRSHHLWRSFLQGRRVNWLKNRKKQPVMKLKVKLTIAYWKEGTMKKLLRGGYIK